MKHPNNQQKKLFYSKMSLNWAMKLSTYLLVIGIGLGIPTILGFLYATLFTNRIFLLFPLPFLLIFFSTWLVSPKAISISKKYLEIERPIGPVKMDLTEISQAKRIIDPQKSCGFIWRLWGSGGAWGTFGLFWSKKLGKFRMYTTNNNFVLIEMKNGKKFLVSPDKQDIFLEKMKKIIN